MFRPGGGRSVDVDVGMQIRGLEKDRFEVVDWRLTVVPLAVDEVPSAAVIR